jgi:hypothetical protein
MKGWNGFFSKVINGASKAASYVKGGVTKVTGAFTPKSQVNGKIITPAHKKSTCFVNSAVGAFSNMNGIDKIYDEASKKALNTEKVSITTADDTKSDWEEFTATNKDIDQAKMAEELHNIKHGKQNTLSSDALKKLGYKGQNGHYNEAFSKLLKTLGIDESEFDIVHLRPSPEIDVDGMDAVLKQLDEKINVTYFLGTNTNLPLVGNRFAHVYVLHQIPDTFRGGCEYLVANDMKNMFNYSAGHKKIKKDEAKKLVEKSCIAYIKRKSNARRYSPLKSKKRSPSKG